MTKNKTKKTVEPVEKKNVCQDGEVLEERLEEELITLSRNEYEEMQARINEACKKAEDHLDGWHRERADFSNYKKRLERDQAQMRQTITGEVLKKYLVILDDMERALKNRPSDGGEGEAWATGVELISQKLKTILEQEGILPVAEEKGEFDPTCHEAISSEESPTHESGEIIEVLQQGYKMPDGRVLRPAMVRVAR
jgi:molecular chaperone GrpE